MSEGVEKVWETRKKPQTDFREVKHNGIGRLLLFPIRLDRLAKFWNLSGKFQKQPWKEMEVQVDVNFNWGE